MKSQGSRPIDIPPDVAAKCDSPNQFANFDRLFRSVIALPKSAADKIKERPKRQYTKKRKSA